MPEKLINQQPNISKMKLNKVQQEFISLLQNSEFPQITSGRLYDELYDEDDKGTGEPCAVCAMGLWIYHKGDLTIEDTSLGTTYPEIDSVAELNLTDEGLEFINKLNDKFKMTFKQIGDFIAENPHEFFKK